LAQIDGKDLVFHDITAQWTHAEIFCGAELIVAGSLDGADMHDISVTGFPFLASAGVAIVGVGAAEGTINRSFKIRDLNVNRCKFLGKNAGGGKYPAIVTVTSEFAACLNYQIKNVTATNCDETVPGSHSPPDTDVLLVDIRGAEGGGAGWGGPPRGHPVHKADTP